MNEHDKHYKAKTWWGAVWRGLIVDSQAKHYLRMRSAIWLFLYLIVHADRKTGELRRKYITISTDMGISERTIRRWLERLHYHNYIMITHTGRSQVIHIRKWKPLSS